jgi:hypothetical protein
MALLIRAGLPSRRAAILAVREGDGHFFDRAGMRSWLESESVQAATETGTWPSPDTAALWNRFRREALAGGSSKWTERSSKRVLDPHSVQEKPSPGTYRVEIDSTDGNLWICTPDYKRIASLKSKIADQKPSLFSARFTADDTRVEIQRLGKDRAKWIAHPD